MILNPRTKIVEVARRYLALRETSPNRGPHLEEFWSKTTYADGAQNREPWCSAFVTFCVWQADRESPLIHLPVPPRFPAVREWEPWALRKDVGCQVFKAADIRRHGLYPMAGDIVTFLPNLSHIGIVSDDYDGRGLVATIEGNTNADGARDGNGVWTKIRNIAFCGTFIRIPCVAIAA